MKERPILFSGEMVRQILAGNKSQTRRVVKPQPSQQIAPGQGDSSVWFEPSYHSPSFKCPYGKPGDHLFVRESIRVTRAATNGEPLAEPPVWYIADGECPEPDAYPFVRSSIHMPRWASRITLEITDVRVERIDAISCDDAMREGISLDGARPGYDVNIDGEFTCEFIVSQFRDLWNKINGKKHPWASNPFVWVLEFKKI